ncbi:MAG: zf-TFIIB domain-containing protein [Bdellovibrionales bacterium]
MSSKLLRSPAYPVEKNVFLQPVVVAGVEVDICPRSGGLWFDRFELDRFDEAHEDFHELLAMIPKNPEPPEILKSRRSPRHPEAIMHQQPYGPKGANGALTIDKCPVCAGIWLDFKELKKIRELYPKKADKEKAIEALVHDAFKHFPRTKSSKDFGFLHKLFSRYLE